MQLQLCIARSTSLLQHLNKTDIKLLTSTSYLGGSGSGSGSGGHTLIALGKARIYPVTGKYEYFPQLGNGYPGFYQQIDMDKWWNQLVMILDYQRITRKDIVLAAANKDGGARVDSKLTKEYETLSNYHSIGNFSFDMRNLKMQLPIKDAHFVCLRQMGYEILNSTELTDILNTQT